jgi:hypothetical protein
MSKIQLEIAFLDKYEQMLFKVIHEKSIEAIQSGESTINGTINEIRHDVPRLVKEALDERAVTDPQAEEILPRVSKVRLQFDVQGQIVSTIVPIEAIHP